MADLESVKGIIIKSEPIGEYDRRLVILTSEMGKISVFAKNARKANNRFVAGTNLFCCGEFFLYRGRNSYSVNEIKINNYFSRLRENFESAYLGMYFAELADYYGRENSDDKEMLKLLYQSLRALESDSFNPRLVKAIYEIKIIAVNGEFRIPDNDSKLLDDTKYAVNYIVNTASEKLFTFSVSEKVLAQMNEIGENAVKNTVEISPKSMEILKSLQKEE